MSSKIKSTTKNLREKPQTRWLAKLSFIIVILKIYKNKRESRNRDREERKGKRKDFPSAGFLLKWLPRLEARNTNWICYVGGGGPSAWTPFALPVTAAGQLDRKWGGWVSSWGPYRSWCCNLCHNTGFFTRLLKQN